MRIVKAGATLGAMKDIQSRIDESVDELMEALSRLVGELAPEAVERRVSQRRRRTAPRRTVVSRSPVDVQALAERLYAEICDHPGERMMVLKTALGQTCERLA